MSATKVPSRAPSRNSSSRLVVSSRWSFSPAGGNRASMSSSTGGFSASAWDSSPGSGWLLLEGGGGGLLEALLGAGARPEGTGAALISGSGGGIWEGTLFSGASKHRHSTSTKAPAKSRFIPLPPSPYRGSPSSWAFFATPSRSSMAAGLLTGLRRSAAGWKVPVIKVPFFSMNWPCCFVTLKSF